MAPTRKNEKPMKLRYSVAAILLSLATAPSALAGSVTQPGDTMGSASGAPVPPGFYIANQANWGCTSTTPDTCVFTEIPLFAWSMPWKIFGGQPVIAAAPTTWVNLDIDDTHNASDLFNPFVGAELAWDLGGGWGFNYLLGAYFDVDSPIAYSSSSLNQRFALSYTANEWNLTANVIWGINFDEVTSDPQGFPCPTAPELGCNPDFINLDLTATKKFDRWEVGAIGFYATDISTPIAGYRRQSKAAVGALVGYWFDSFILQTYVTTEVYEENYGGEDTRLWSRLVFPLGNPPTRPIAY
jgi:hypothetical protein